jgi:hypothetical protein
MTERNLGVHGRRGAMSTHRPFAAWRLAWGQTGLPPRQAASGKSSSTEMRARLRVQRLLLHYREDGCPSGIDVPSGIGVMRQKW